MYISEKKKKNSFNIVRRQRLTKETILEMLPGFLLQGALPKDIRRGQQISPTQENNLVLKVSTETAFRKPSPRLFLPLYLDQRAQQVHSTEQRLCKGFWEKRRVSRMFPADWWLPLNNIFFYICFRFLDFFFPILSSLKYKFLWQSFPNLAHCTKVALAGLSNGFSPENRTCFTLNVKPFGSSHLGRGQKAMDGVWGCLLSSLFPSGHQNRQ